MAFGRGWGKGKKRAKVRLPKGTMNSNETAFSLVLEQWKQEGKIRSYEFEGLTLRLAPLTTLTLDFFVVDADGLCMFFEVKGGKKDGKYHIEDDAWQKTKIAAKMFPYFPIVLTWSHKDYGRKYKEVLGLGEDDEVLFHEQAEAP